MADLFGFNSILCSTNWNKNDDVFDPQEVWAGRETPIDKPFNLEHRPREIIGHTIDAYPVDNGHSRLAVDVPPNNYNLLACSVIYRHIACRDKDLEEEVGKLIEEIQAGQWAVSMECIFDNFDYALRSEASEAYEVVERSERTAHLTKRLRAYGGTGTYQGRRLGRVLRSITFSAIGLTKTPANEESIIF